MSGSAVLRAKKLKGAAIVRAAAAHNKRTLQADIGATERIDPTRTHLNECIAGPPSPADVAQRARALMVAARIGKMRKDAVRAIELIVSLAPRHGIDDRAFFDDAMRWLAGRFGGIDNILSADIHRDEAAPHLHVMLLPLIAGRMNGSDALGGRAKLMALHKDFHAEVAARYGLKRATAQLRGGAKAVGASAVFEHLRTADDAAMHSAAWGTIHACIAHDPGPFLATLGIELPGRVSKPLRSMTAIFIGKGKGSAAPEPPQPYRVVRRANE